MINTPNTVTIDLSALVHNIEQVQKLTGGGARIMGVVKSDAYGHGLLPVSHLLTQCGVDALGVGYFHEAVRLRKDGVKGAIIILCGVHTREECRGAVTFGLTPVLYDLEPAALLAREAQSAEQVVRAYVKVDTGMGRLGLSTEELPRFIENVSVLRGLKIDGLLSHLACADEPDDGFTTAQLRRFDEAGHTTGLGRDHHSIANSAGIMAADVRSGVVRPGIMLYGGLPAPAFTPVVNLRPVMTFKSRILQIRDLPHHTPVSYGRTYFTNGVRRVAVLSAGYGDGLPRALSNRGHVLIGGQRAPIIGTVCMNLTVCDVTGQDRVRVGDEAVFLGTQGSETITADEIARHADTISYEVLCSIGQRNTKEYI